MQRVEPPGRRSRWSSTAVVVAKLFRERTGLEPRHVKPFSGVGDQMVRVWGVSTFDHAWYYVVTGPAAVEVFPGPREQHRFRDASPAAEAYRRYRELHVEMDAKR